MKHRARDACQREFPKAKAGGRLKWLFLAVGAVLCLAASSRAQANHGATLHVHSTLVLVPTFVYNERPVKDPSRAQWYRCASENWELLSELPPSNPFLPEDCRQGVVRGLTAKDFQLFQNGVKQKIRSAKVQEWSVVVRDNRTWHYEFSFTPDGKWSTPDLAPLKFYPDGRDSLYLLTYVPPGTKTGTCQKIRVKVDRRVAHVIARRTYCAGQSPSDPLYGTKFGRQLQSDLASGKRARLPMSIQAGSLYGPEDQTRVSVSLSVSWKSLQHEWNPISWTLHATIGVLGIISRKDGTIAGRFSDLAYPAYWPTFVSGNMGAARGALIFLDTWQMSRLTTVDPAWIPNRYETQIPLAPGSYDLRVVLSDGKKFGRAEMPLVVGKSPEKRLVLSSILLCKRFRDAAAAATEAAKADFAPQYVPLVSKGIQFSAAADTSFSPTDPLFAYFQIYEPSPARAASKPVEVRLRILAAKNGKVSENFAPVSVASYEKPGNPVISVARKVPISQLSQGAYELQIRATGPGGTTPWRTVRFTVL